MTIKILAAALLMSIGTCSGQTYSNAHIIYVIQENHSFDQYFGQFPGASGSLTWTDHLNATHTLTHLSPTLKYGDSPHSHDSIVTFIGNSVSTTNGWDLLSANAAGTSLDGVTADTNGTPTGYYDNGDIPQYWRLALNYGLADHMFSPTVPSQPGHREILGDIEEIAGNPGNTDDGDNQYSSWTCASNKKLGVCAGGSSVNNVCVNDAGCPSSTCTFPSSPPFIRDMLTKNDYSGSGAPSNYYSIALTGSPSGKTVGTQYISGRCNGSAVNVGASCECLRNGTNPCTDTVHCGNSSTCNPRVSIDGQPGNICSFANNLFTLLDNTNTSWGHYGPSFGTGGAEWMMSAYYSAIYNGSDWTNKVHPVSQLTTDIQNCTLPTISFVTPDITHSEHWPAKVKDGEDQTAGFANALMHSPCYYSTTMFIVWDDFGGMEDHVLPPVIDGLHLGPRVPFLCVGWACKNQVTTTQFEFSSVVRYLENKFSLCPGHSPANDGCLDKRDATATSIAGMIDENQSPVVPPAQSARTGSFSGSMR